MAMGHHTCVKVQFDQLSASKLVQFDQLSASKLVALSEQHLAPRCCTGSRAGSACTSRANVPAEG